MARIIRSGTTFIATPVSEQWPTDEEKNEGVTARAIFFLMVTLCVVTVWLFGALIWVGWLP